jgi:hypothetical protein
MRKLEPERQRCTFRNKIVDDKKILLGSLYSLKVENYFHSHPTKTVIITFIVWMKHYSDTFKNE